MEVLRLFHEEVSFAECVCLIERKIWRLNLRSGFFLNEKFEIALNCDKQNICKFRKFHLFFDVTWSFAVGFYTRKMRYFQFGVWSVSHNC